MGAEKICVNNELIFDQPLQAKDSMSFLLGLAEENRLRYSFTAGQAYKIHIDTVLQQPRTRVYTSWMAKQQFIAAWWSRMRWRLIFLMRR
jgi:hypothetical protein